MTINQWIESLKIAQEQGLDEGQDMAILVDSDKKGTEGNNNLAFVSPNTFQLPIGIKFSLYIEPDEEA